MSTVCLTAFTLATGSARAADISGAGATLPIRSMPNGPMPTKKETGLGLNYHSIGSGGSIKQIKDTGGNPLFTH